MIFNFFIHEILSVSNSPVYPQPTCDPASKQYFNSFSYACDTLDAGTYYNTNTMSLDENETLRCNTADNFVYYDGTNAPTCVATDPGDATLFEEDNFYYTDNSGIPTNDARLRASYAACTSTGGRSPKYCNFIANYYAASEYTDTTYNALFPSSTGTSNGYTYWPAGIPWVAYPVSLSSVNDQELITSQFSYDQVITFVLAKYAPQGQFLGYIELGDDFVFCGGDQNITQIWRVFGSNFQSQCTLNITRYLSNDHSFYEPFFLENGMLRPIPVLISSSQSTRPFRRFFLYTNLYQNRRKYATNISISFQLRDDGGRTILPPLFEITYATDDRSADSQYVFDVTYVQSFSRFWRSVIIVAAVFGALALAYFVFKVYTYTQHYGDDGMDGKVIIGILGEFLHIVGVILFFIVFVFAFYILIFFKWQKDIYMFLPNESELRPFLIMQWVAFACVTVATIIKIVQTAGTDVFIIDWEEKRNKDAPISAWRRLMLSNEWVRIFTIRSYNIPFTIISLLFILTGFKTDLMATPIPTDKLLDTGETYKVLRFAYTSFIWLLFMLVEWIFTTFIYWNMIGNPFHNFLDLAATANCSVIMLASNSYGYYLHGRSIHVNADESMEKLHQNLATEADNTIGLRGLVPNTNDQVFEIYLHQAFRNKFKETYNNVMNSVKPRRLANEKVFSSASVSLEALQSFDRLNKFLQQFIDNVNEYEIRPAPFTQQYLGIAPTVTDKSIFLIEQDNSFKNTMLAGIEWTVMLFLLLLFVGVETETKSPPIAAFVTIIVDILITAFVRTMGRSNIAKKSLIDNRFIIS